MTKRSFIKRFTAILGGWPGARLFGQAPGRPPSGARLTNWAGNYTYNTANVHRLTSIEQVRTFVKRHDALRVLGTRHCFNGIADSPHALISLEAMSDVVLDEKARTVTVEAGVTYGRLCPLLHQKGVALHNLASLPHISIAGACATATHGSGIKQGNLATAVSALELVTASGDLLTLSRTHDGDTFLGAVVNLGALGVMTRVTLDVQPTFRIRQDVYVDLPLAQLAEHFEAIMSSGYSVSLFTDWQKKRIKQVWIKRRVEDGETIQAADPEFHGARVATRNLHPIAELSAENCTEQMGVPGPWYERLPHFRMGYTPSSGKELQSEYFVPRKDAVEAILAIERLRDRVGPHLLISELRTIDADRLWMSTCYARPSLAIHFTWKPDWDAVRALLPVIENALAPYAVRPHWGKLFTVEPAQLRSRYEKMSDFKDLLKQHDPRGKFRNGFVTGILDG
jgi:alditol oxidase